jgi:ADP-ribosylglycohydrolase
MTQSFQGLAAAFSAANRIEHHFLSIMAIADAYAMKYEFVEHDPDITYHDLFYGPHPWFNDYKAAHYSDDTQMSIANAELLLTGKTSFKDDEFIETWLAAFKRDPRVGYSRYMYQVMNEAQNAADFRVRINGKGDTSGGMMRAGVFGLLADIRAVKKLAVQQAKITHDTPAGRNAALAAALGVHFLHHGGSKSDVWNFIDHHLPKNWMKNGYKDDAGNALNIMQSLLNVVHNSRTMSHLLVYTANCGRVTDTDTICATAALMASRDVGFRNDLPHILYATLENGAYGMDYLQALDKRLMAAFPRQRLYEYGAWQKPVPNGLERKPELG